MKKPEIIGISELVSLDDYGLSSVPAKIDTGADTSAIWASAVKLSSNGKLNFRLFDKTSPYYSGKKISLSEFKKVRIANAHGEQSRFKIKLAVSIRGQIIHDWFTLADRSGLVYPILIGRGTLHKRFVVDVSKAAPKSQNRSKIDVLLIGSLMPNESFAAILAGTTSAKVLRSSLDKLLFCFKDKGASVIDTRSNLDISDFNFVYFKSSKRYFEFAASAASYLESLNVNFVDRELATCISYDKLTEMMELATNGLALPAGYCGSSVALLKNLDKITSALGWPLVVKEIHEDRGRQNYLLANSNEIERVLTGAASQQYFIIQKYIKNDGYLRCYVLGDKVRLAINRKPVIHKNALKSHLNNPTGSANASLLKLEDVDQPAVDLAKRSAMCLNRQVAGVDLIYDLEDNVWRVLEVNSAPQLVTGSFLKEKRAAVAEFIGEELA